MGSTVILGYKMRRQEVEEGGRKRQVWDEKGKGGVKYDQNILHEILKEVIKMF